MLLMLWTTRMCCYWISAFLLHCLTCNLQNITMSCEIGSTTFCVAFRFFFSNSLIYTRFFFPIISSMFTSKQITSYYMKQHEKKGNNKLQYYYWVRAYRNQTSIFNSKMDCDYMNQLISLSQSKKNILLFVVSLWWYLDKIQTMRIPNKITLNAFVHSLE